MTILMTCDETPCPPLTGNNKKTHDLILALLEFSHDVIVFCYPRNANDANAAITYWAGKNVNLTFGRRRKVNFLKTILYRYPKASLSRDFKLEHDWITSQVTQNKSAVLIVDMISGAPILTRRLNVKKIVSGHDCMSRLNYDAYKTENDLRKKIIYFARFYLYKRLELKYAHLADSFHVVSKAEAEAITKVNPCVKTFVIPIGGAPKPVISNLRANRTRKIIWGNLSHKMIYNGLIKFIDEIKGERNALDLQSWTYYGSVSESDARKSIPSLFELGIGYSPYMENLSSVLAETRVILLPDYGGSGQKNRAIDGFAHGCCVAGLPDVFNDIEESQAFVCRNDFKSIMKVLTQMTQEECDKVSLKAVELYDDTFSAGTIGRRWQRVITDPVVYGS